MGKLEELNKLFVEAVLKTFVETASTKAPNYRVTSPKEFEMLVSQDPTYDQSVDDGKFIDWIFSLWRNYKTDEKNEEKYNSALSYKKEHPDAQLPPKKEKLSQDKFEDFEKIKGLLNTLKDRVNLKTFDMNQFKSVADLAAYVRNFQEKDIPVDEKAEENYKVFRAAIDDGLEVVYDGPNFVIGVPTTYEASSHFKEPVTNWCTAYPESYDYYLKIGGKYYIHLNKHTGELYQAHYESNQFKNASDKEINKKDFIEKYPELKLFYDKIWDMNNAEWWMLHSKQPTEEEQLAIVQRDGNLIRFMKNPPEKVQLAAVKQNGKLIYYIKNPSEAVQLAAVKQNVQAIGLIKNPSEEIQLFAIKQSGYAICYIQNPSEKVQLEAIKQNGLAIEDIKLATVKRDGFEIGFIKNPSEAVQLAAVKQDGLALGVIENPSEKVQMTAVKQNGGALKYIENPSDKVQLAAVQQNGYAIAYIQNPSEEVQLAAVKRDPKAIDYIKNPYQSVIKYVNEHK